MRDKKRGYGRQTPLRPWRALEYNSDPVHGIYGVFMVVKKIARGGLIGAFLRWSGKLRFPTLFLLMTVLFVINLFIPDVVPFADEIIMGLVAALLANIRKKPAGEHEGEGQGSGDH